MILYFKKKSINNPKILININLKIKKRILNIKTNNGCLINEKKIKSEDNKTIYNLEIWDLSNTLNTMRFNRFPITRKFYFVDEAQIIILCCEPRVPHTIETMKMLYDISKVRADPKQFLFYA